MLNSTCHWKYSSISWGLLCLFTYSFLMLLSHPPYNTSLNPWMNRRQDRQILFLSMSVTSTEWINILSTRSMADAKIQYVYKMPIQTPPAAHSTGYKSFSVAWEWLVILSPTHVSYTLTFCLFCLGCVRQDSLNNNQKDSQVKHQTQRNTKMAVKTTKKNNWFLKKPNTDEEGENEYPKTLWKCFFAVLVWDTCGPL